MLRVTDLIFDYSDKLLLHDVHFSVNQGEVLHVKGKNGSGKTTLLKLLAGLLHPISGDIFYEGALCYVGHQHGVNARLTPYEHVRFDLGVTDKHVLDETLTRLNLNAVRDMPCGLLSAGQKRRVGLLRLLIMDAKLWLLDEPLVGLDAASMYLLGSLIVLHLKQAGSVILTSHQALPFDLDAGVLQELNL
ncbi:MAG: heme ABC exporter ATP-binding protein CcmA [Gammaproteobacteria bacterium]|nr:heme ABC exporter ATP-binding protein CcmA [Gammaproteobacteria bacterium]MCH9716948.1 heme ABC exporter ATP-binding protein CcmA [Gammaproteobacteria bacterium]MCH9763002.1 heme ABC exporter ATP-binding protein CcmA [Gammaproteobacteria bacterium]